MTLVDGGLLNPVPIGPTFRDLTDLTMAVNLTAESADDAAEHGLQARFVSYSIRSAAILATSARSGSGSSS